LTKIFCEQGLLFLKSGSLYNAYNGLYNELGAAFAKSNPAHRLKGVFHDCTYNAKSHCTQKIFSSQPAITYAIVEAINAHQKKTTGTGLLWLKTNCNIPESSVFSLLNQWRKPLLTQELLRAKPSQPHLPLDAESKAYQPRKESAVSRGA